MDENSRLKVLKKLLLNNKSAILYTPLQSEVNYAESSFPLEVPSDKAILPTNKNTDPFEWADICINHFKKSNPYILIPGNKFDIYGTRHGRGAGWYDRFLFQVPKEWLRIGITESPKLFFDKLAREPWDEPVDWIISYNQATFSWKTYETFARKK